MAESVLERISQHIESTLNGVKKVNGYESDFTVKRRSRRGDAPEAGQTLCVIHQGQPIQLTDVSQDQTGWDQPYGFDIYVDPAEDLETPVDALINRARADAEKALALEVESNTRAGLAFETRILSPILFIDGALHGLQVRCMVRYFTRYNDPMTSAYSSE